jgi:hypothetical protein
MVPGLGCQHATAGRLTVTGQDAALPLRARWEVLLPPPRDRNSTPPSISKRRTRPMLYPVCWQIWRMLWPPW